MSKIKGITIWEQNAEYFALGIAGLALLGFVAMQLIGEPNAVEISGHGKVTPGDVDDRLVQAAERLDAMLSPQASPPVEIGDPVPVLPEFEQALASGVSPSSSMRALVASVPVPIGEHVRVGETFTVPHVPQPTTAVARQYFDTLADGVVDSYELGSMFGETPHDVTWVTAAAAIDLEQIVESYTRTGPDDLAPVPTSWHAGQATILDVRVEREQRIDGQWTNRTLMEPLPGQVSHRSDIEQGVDATRREGIVRAARDLEMQRAIARPAFYSTRNSAFLPPDPLADEIEVVGEVNEELAADLRRLQMWERDRQGYRDRLEELGGPVGDSPSSPGSTPGGTSPGSSGPSVPSGPGASGSRSAPTDAGAGQSRANEDTRRNLMRRIERLDRRIEQLRATLPIQDPSQQGSSEQEDGPYVVWAHDLTVEPGQVYRYRVIVDIYNPFYLRRLNLVDEQQDLAEKMAMSSPAGEWSEPIEARAPLHPYITSAYAPGQDRGAVSGSDMGHAIAEVYRFYDGRWWHSRFTVEPGERVGEVRTEDGQQAVDYQTEWFVLDIIEDRQFESSQGPGREGRAARVVLQHMQSGEIMELRHPVTDLQNPTRLRLQDETEFANVG